MTESFEGASCTATLDVDASTLTFVHRGWTATSEQKRLSPVVVPLGDVEGVEYEWRRFTGWFRVRLHSEQPWPRKVHTDPHGLTCGEDPGPFVALVKAAVAAAEPLPVPVGQAPTAEPVSSSPPTPAPEPDGPSVAGKVAKGLGKSIVDGMFRSF
ncbi:DUF4429 domain-containing protein [Rhodococcus sp. IEGM 1330]|uniref:DUF4429 domain-containing protein n=1 Tax=Rhodococcus sp. IEGM 1330 TaxID=3082225 RepID=UPI002953EC7F|nr:DUF4429 domain-containing protein [Rhodococcus sp. IEGM 1330]MDV8024893.1 DUF4429 domain-containing protein [Rhodococcus sp. IEGM 1330]